MADGDRKITFTLNMPDADIVLLQSAISAKDVAGVERFLSALALGATEMLVEELLGRAEYPTKTAARQARLLKIAKHGFANRMPSAEVVAALFHLTPAAAANLIASTGARYAPELKAARSGSAKAALLGSARVSAWAEAPANFKYQFACTDGSVVPFLRELLASSPDAITNVVRSRDTANVYEVDGGALRFLAATWAMEVREFVHPSNQAAWDEKVAKAAKNGAAP